MREHGTRAARFGFSSHGGIKVGSRNNEANRARWVDEESELSHLGCRGKRASRLPRRESTDEDAFLPGQARKPVFRHDYLFRRR